MSIVDMDAHPSRYIYKQTAGNLPTDCMEIKRRTQEERSAATREALITGARKLWGLRGYAEVGTPEIATEAGVTRGAMYHQFADKAALFRDVVEVVEQDVMARMATLVAASGAATPADAIRAAVDAWLEVSGDPEVRQLVLLDAPVVLGWAGFRDVAQRYSLGMTEQLITEAIRAGQLARQPVRPLAQVLIGALDEAAMFIATADDPKRARRETRQVLRRLIDGMLNG
ncbi:Transcriptional regulator [Mycobacterium tuberculosis variant bovis]|nr:transcriptional regulator [Mycobacterium tuberculosis variant bovis BCG str. Korea 1168P]CEJ32128.1 Transcriptional regulator [Mycobacterium tuberculosis variant bovis]CEJ37233.1 Transcriptional regulator [Mycobacterium tuberculosis variant bovis]CEJ38403.1 Transcriptional regulator [Mycobacterium tuberculosis variant bovis]CEJ50285.1 Transcriptional regulator [Mycobacterium tuberculosis variant caprae]